MAKANWKTIMKPEEKLACRLLERHNLEPPYDLVELASLYAKVEYLNFPIKADGIAINISSNLQPEILINRNNAATRKKFTLAHELGHIIIPWHTGIIISHTNAEGNPRSLFEYREIEAEANRFAAELLMPQSWINKINDESIDFFSAIRTIQQKSETSFEAVIIKFFQSIKDDAIVCAEMNSEGICEKIHLTQIAPSQAYQLNGAYIESGKQFNTSDWSDIKDFGTKRFRAWHFPITHREIYETDNRSWRDILDIILSETQSREKRQSANATFNSTFHKALQETLEEHKLAGKIIALFDGRPNLASICNHPLFDQYVIKRTKGLLSRN